MARRLSLLHDHCFLCAGPPSVQVAKATPFNTREPVMLACYVWGFYPADVTITWMKNGQLVPPHGSAHNIIQSNGDWTYQTLSHLATTPSFGDTYTCVVQHFGALEPIFQNWSKCMVGWGWGRVKVGSYCKWWLKVNTNISAEAVSCGEVHGAWKREMPR